MTTNIQALSLRISTIVLFCLMSLRSLEQDTILLNTNKKIVSSYFSDVINNQKLNRMGEFYAQDYIWHQMNGIDTHSNIDSSHISTLKWLFAAIPGLHYTIEQIIAEGDMIALSTTVTGTAKSELFGLPAAQKKVRFKQMFFFRLKENKITEEWEVADIDGMKAQLVK